MWLLGPFRMIGCQRRELRLSQFVFYTSLTTAEEIDLIIAAAFMIVIAIFAATVRISASVDRLRAEIERGRD